MSGESNLKKLLSSLSPVLTEGEYVFCTFADAEYGDYSEFHPVAAIGEDEGLTLVIPKTMADQHDLSYESVYKKITLQVHSSLDAVGLTAAFAGKLADYQISANVCAGLYHDHLFVQSRDANRALEALSELTG